MSNDFPDDLYVPFTIGERILNDLADFDIQQMGGLVGCDFWGLYIRRKDGSIDPIYNAFPYAGDCEIPEWLNHIRIDLENEFASLVLSKVTVGDTLTILMFNSEGWAVDALREENGWSFAYRHHINYGALTAGQKARANKPTTFDFHGILLDAHQFESIVGTISEVAGHVRRHLAVHMKDMSIVTLLFEPNVLEGNCRSLVSYYPPGTVLPADQEVEEQGTEAEGRKLLFWLDWHSRSIPVY